MYSSKSTSHPVHLLFIPESSSALHISILSCHGPHLSAYTVSDRVNVMTPAVNVNITDQLNRSLVNILINHSLQYRKDVQDLCYLLTNVVSRTRTKILKVGSRHTI